MVQRPSFGRRGGETRQQARPAPARLAPKSYAAETAEPPPVIVRVERDEELEAWKRSRKRHIPWKQLSLMASLCFGVASFVLPKSVNDAVQYPLYALAAASFYAGIRKRKS